MRGPAAAIKFARSHTLTAPARPTICTGLPPTPIPVRRSGRLHSTTTPPSMAASPSTPSPGAAFAVGSFPGGISEESVFPRPPPPTPKGHMPLPSTADATLTALFDRMVLSPPVPILRLGTPSRLKIRSPVTPLVSLDSPDLASLRAAGDVGYFHLVGHGIPSQLPSSALAELSRVDASALRASILRTLGFSVEDEEVDADDEPVMVFDVDGQGMDALPAALEYARLMREVGMQVVGLFSGSGEVGFGEKPFPEGGRKARCLVWVSKVGSGESAMPPAAGDAKAYPYVVGLHCQWEQEAGASTWVMDDSGEWRAVGKSDGALLVTIGDIAQVWSNGKLKKVRGVARPTPAPTGNGEAGEPARLSITVLITLPLDSVVSPLLPLSAGEDGGHQLEEEEKGVVSEDGEEDGCSFRSFSLESYAWGLYHDRLQFKDPLARYRID
ncbi:2-oxoglutarate-dependent dioxygenase DAO [Hordeum vulgare]|nr:2-oxoglutarate-dependent dioxygenase DAO [Hordeum vulgare]